METQEFIPVEILCRQHGIEVSFISSLQEYGLVEIITVNEADCIPANYLPETEKLVRLHDELGLNMEGLDVITHLLQRMKKMQEEMLILRNRLRLYESND
jgi:chaperone modulatory protein CbpM